MYEKKYLFRKLFLKKFDSKLWQCIMEQKTDRQTDTHTCMIYIQNGHAHSVNAAENCSVLIARIYWCTVKS